MKKKLTAFFAAAFVALGLSGAAALSGCTSTAELAYTLSEDGTHYIVSVSGSASALTEAEILEEYGEEGEKLPVTEIASQGFFGCDHLTSIVIPDSITTIGASAFAYCTKLSSVTLSQNLETIPYGIFGKCENIFSVEIPASVTAIQYGAFMYSSIKSIIIPETVQTIGNYCFYYCTELETADIKCEITTVPYGTFFSCTSLTSVILPSTITEIKGEDTITYTADDGTETESTYYAAFSYGYLSAGSQYITYDYTLEYLYFRGTEEQWAAVTVGENNYALDDDATQIVCNYTD